MRNLLHYDIYIQIYGTSNMSLIVNNTLYIFMLYNERYTCLQITSDPLPSDHRWHTTLRSQVTHCPQIAGDTLPSDHRRHTTLRSQMTHYPQITDDTPPSDHRWHTTLRSQVTHYPQITGDTLPSDHRWHITLRSLVISICSNFKFQNSVHNYIIAYISFHIDNIHCS